MARKERQELKIGDRAVSVSSLDKPMYPTGFTKGQVIDYYIRVSRWLLPHLKRRPLTLKRYPEGIEGEHFYEKDAPGFTPDWVPTFPVPRRAGGKDIRYIVIDDLPALVWAANLANLELHPFLHRAPKLDVPTSVVFDLDPGEGATVLTCARVAFLLRDLFGGLGLQAFPKVSGSKGLQVYVPLNTAVHYKQTQPFARAVAELMTRRHPELIVAEMAKELRPKKVFIDWSQNSDFKTTVGVYSLRAKRRTPFVSMPVTWEELQTALDADDSHPLYFQPDAAIERLERVGDLFAPVLTLKQKLPKDIAGAGNEPPKRVRKARATAPKSLESYRAKRDFTRTAEPEPSLPRASHQGGRRRFVIQKHAASHLHYDFRLELAGVLKSWAVPKGPPFALEEKRLAMATEDHPLEYLDFEGTIPAGQYGGGTVMVWDIGTYEIIEGNYWKGSLRIFLEGRKLKGEWQLLRDPGRGDRNWSLIKTAAPMKPLTAKQDDSSALTGRTMKEIAAAGDRVWQSNRTAKDEPDLSAWPSGAARFIEPMRAKLVSALPEGGEWRYEIKLDGYRVLAVKNAGRVSLLSRHDNALNDRFPAVAEACRALDDGTVLDGEVVALDEQGRPS
ncbi:MAG TPA: non-homologous end-joining DNA ligase, partial [Bryobacteraceae bacterium]|nr:non-homologous end-joining DNA ligase [Bryobacteraceae bacterium]